MIRDYPWPHTPRYLAVMDDDVLVTNRTRLDMLHAALAADPHAAGWQSEVTVGIKHTSTFASRRTLLRRLIHSLRREYGQALAVVVVDDGDRGSGVRPEAGVSYIRADPGSGLGHGRNLMVAAARTKCIRGVEGTP